MGFKTEFLTFRAGKALGAKPRGSDRIFEHSQSSRHPPRGKMHSQRPPRGRRVNHALPQARNFNHPLHDGKHVNHTLHKGRHVNRSLHKARRVNHTLREGRCISAKTVARDLGALKDRYPEVSQNLRDLKFPGRRPARHTSDRCQGLGGMGVASPMNTTKWGQTGPS